MEEQRTRQRRSSGDQETKCWEKRNKARTYIGWGPFAPGGGCTRDKKGGPCPGWSHHPGQKGLLSRVVASPRTKGGPPIYSLNLRLPPTHIFLICTAPPSSRPSRLHAPAALDDDPARPLTSAPPSPAPCHLVFTAPASTPRACALVFAAPGGLHCTPPHRHPLRCAPPRRQLPALSSRAAAPRFPRPV